MLRSVVLAHHVTSQPDVAVDDELLEAVFLVQLGQRSFSELLPYPGYREECRRAAVAEVLGDGCQAAREPRLAPNGDGEEVADHPLGNVAEREERQEPLSFADVDHGRRAADRPHDVGVAHHTPLGGPVVPLVYTSVASCSGVTASARESNRPGSRCRRAAPTACNWSKPM